MWKAAIGQVGGAFKIQILSIFRRKAERSRKKIMLFCKIFLAKTCKSIRKFLHGVKSICSSFHQKNYSPRDSAVQEWMKLGVQLASYVSGSLPPGHINKSPLFWGKSSKINCANNLQ